MKRKNKKKVYVVRWENKLNGKTGISQRFTKEKAKQLCKKADKDFRNARHWVEFVGVLKNDDI